MAPRPRFLAPPISVLISIALLVGSAGALPPVGSSPTTTTTLEDADGRALDARAAAGRPMLVVYEDRDTSQQNAPLKRDLKALAGETPRFAALFMLPVADVSDYDYWPAKGFVRSAIRDESTRAGLSIYCDWDGGFRGALQLRRKTSSVVLIGKDGRVLFAAEGSLSADARKRVVALVRTEIGA